MIEKFLMIKIYKIRIKNTINTVCQWLESDDGARRIRHAFESTSRYIKLRDIKPCLTGRDLYLRFKAFTGDAMGMNMVSKAVERALECLVDVHADVQVLALSGNYCIDKKVSALNWIEGRGRSVVCEAILSDSVVRKVCTIFSTHFFFGI